MNMSPDPSILFYLAFGIVFVIAYSIDAITRVLSGQDR